MPFAFTGNHHRLQPSAVRQCISHFEDVEFDNERRSSAQCLLAKLSVNKFQRRAPTAVAVGELRSPALCTQVLSALPQLEALEPVAGVTTTAVARPSAADATRSEMKRGPPVALPLLIPDLGGWIRTHTSKLTWWFPRSFNGQGVDFLSSAAHMDRTLERLVSADLNRTEDAAESPSASMPLPLSNVLSLGPLREMHLIHVMTNLAQRKITASRRPARWFSAVCGAAADCASGDALAHLPSPGNDFGEADAFTPVHRTSAVQIVAQSLRLDDHHVPEPPAPTFLLTLTTEVQGRGCTSNGRVRPQRLWKCNDPPGLGTCASQLDVRAAVFPAGGLSAFQSRDSASGSSIAPASPLPLLPKVPLRWLIANSFSLANNRVPWLVARAAFPTWASKLADSNLSAAAGAYGPTVTSVLVVPHLEEAARNDMVAGVSDEALRGSASLTEQEDAVSAHNHAAGWNWCAPRDGALVTAPFLREAFVAFQESGEFFHWDTTDEQVVPQLVLRCSGTAEPACHMELWAAVAPYLERARRRAALEELVHETMLRAHRSSGMCVPVSMVVTSLVGGADPVKGVVQPLLGALRGSGRVMWILPNDQGVFHDAALVARAVHGAERWEDHVALVTAAALPHFVTTQCMRRPVAPWVVVTHSGTPGLNLRQLAGLRVDGQRVMRCCFEIVASLCCADAGTGFACAMAALVPHRGEAQSCDLSCQLVAWLPGPAAALSMVSIPALATPKMLPDEVAAGPAGRFHVAREMLIGELSKLHRALGTQSDAWRSLQRWMPRDPHQARAEVSTCVSSEPRTQDFILYTIELLDCVIAIEEAVHLSWQLGPWIAAAFLEGKFVAHSVVQRHRGNAVLGALARELVTTTSMGDETPFERAVLGELAGPASKASDGGSTVVTMITPSDWSSGRTGMHDALAGMASRLSDALGSPVVAAPVSQLVELHQHMWEQCQQEVTGGVVLACGFATLHPSQPDALWMVRAVLQHLCPRNIVWPLVEDCCGSHAGSFDRSAPHELWSVAVAGHAVMQAPELLSQANDVALAERVRESHMLLRSQTSLPPLRGMDIHESTTTGDGSSSSSGEPIFLITEAALAHTVVCQALFAQAASPSGGRRFAVFEAPSHPTLPYDFIVVMGSHAVACIVVNTEVLCTGSMLCCDGQQRARPLEDVLQLPAGGILAALGESFSQVNLLVDTTGMCPGQLARAATLVNSVQRHAPGVVCVVFLEGDNAVPRELAATADTLMQLPPSSDEGCVPYVAVPKLSLQPFTRAEEIASTMPGASAATVLAARAALRVDRVTRMAEFTALRGQARQNSLLGPLQPLFGPE